MAKALSIKQPFAWCILEFGDKAREWRKDVENRTWPCQHRGHLLIHASKTYDKEGADWIRQKFGILVPGPDQLRLGGIVGSVIMTDCVRKHGSKWFVGPYGFVFTKPYPLPFQYCMGERGLFDYPKASMAI